MMWEERAYFNNFLEKCGNFDVQAASEEKIASFVDGVDAEYGSILRGLACKAEDCSVFMDVVKEAVAAGGGPSSGHEQLLGSVKGVMVKMLDNIFSTMPKEMARFNVEVLKRALAAGDSGRAKRIWEKILCFAPDNKKVRQLVADAVRRGKLEPDFAERELSRYRFEYSGRIAPEKRGVLMDVQFVQANESLYVLDFKNGLLDKYGPDGCPLGSLSLNLCRPTGLFSGDESGLWVCDTGNNRLLRLNDRDELADELNFSSLLPEMREGFGPRSGCVRNGTLHVVLANERTKERVTLTLDLDNPGGTIRRLDSLNAVKPARMYGFGDLLYLYTWPGAESALYDMRNDKLLPLERDDRCEFFRGMVKLDNDFYKVSGNNVIKETADHEFIFTCDFSRAISVKNVMPLSITSGKIDGQRYLFIPDNIIGCVHIFSV